MGNLFRGNRLNADHRVNVSLWFDDRPFPTPQQTVVSVQTKGQVFE